MPSSLQRSLRHRPEQALQRSSNIRCPTNKFYCRRNKVRCLTNEDTRSIRNSARWTMVTRLHNAFETRSTRRRNLSIVRYQLPYAENLADDLKAILKVVDWPFTEKFSQVQQPRGLSIRISEQLNRNAEQKLVGQSRLARPD